MSGPDGEYARFKQAVSSVLPVHLDLYKEQQMERRIRDLARKHHAPDLLAFGQMVHTDAALLRELEQHVTINVTEYFRNPEAFEYLRSEVLPYLLAPGGGLRVWSAGCSYGAEPFTLAMLLHEDAPRLKHSIYASDIDRAILERAKSGGGLGLDDIQHLPKRLRDRYISREGPPFKVSDEILHMVRFEHLDLLSGTVSRTFDLIACRNVVIYFTDSAKQMVYKAFVAALRPGGYLFIGATEVISGAAGLGLRYLAPCFYVKVQ